MVQQTPLLLFIPLLPLVGYLVNLAFGRRLSRSASAWVACSATAAAFVVSLVVVYQLVQLPAESRAIEQTVFQWIVSGDLDVPLAFRLDPLSAVMILVVSGIGFLIHVYSAAYMEEEKPSEYARYYSYLNLFAFFMLVLVLGSSFLVMFVGWEGVGLCSYLLIGFWYQKKSASDAGKKAFIVNRIGDYGFLLGIFLVFVTFGTLDFQKVAQAVATHAPDAAFGTVSLIALLLFVGATGKSAQIPLYIWLPDAMEGPTPVSALIHAATMVTAGVYMIGRNAVLYAHAPEVLLVVAIIGAVTAFFAATIGLVQYDIKRVLAYSTVSQLGYMFLAMGVGAFGAGIFHLYTHAFFKALLFLGAGAVIHALHGEQDMRRMGGLRAELPVTYWTFLAATLAIAGVPGLSGFFSKDEILFRAWSTGHFWLWLIGTVTALLTAIYMFRIVFLTFHGPRAIPAVAGGNGNGHGNASRDGHAGHLHDAPPLMAVPLIVLAIGAVVAGYVGFPSALGGLNRIDKFLEPSFEAHLQAPVAGGSELLAPAAAEPLQPATAGEGAAAPVNEGEELELMAMATVVGLGGIALAFFLFLRRRDVTEALARRFAGLHRVLLKKYYVDEAYNAAIVRPLVKGSEGALWRGVDAGVIDGAVNGVGRLVRSASGALRQVQTGALRGYAASLFIGVVLVLAYLLWHSR
jgi:NADH-quinone oxidoreductase subunit L